jgi:hypothetical protein
MQKGCVGREFHLNLASGGDERPGVPRIVTARRKAPGRELTTVSRETSDGLSRRSGSRVYDAQSSLRKHINQVACVAQGVCRKAVLRLKVKVSVLAIDCTQLPDRWSASLELAQPPWR